MWDISWPSYHHVSGISWHDSQRSQCLGLSAGRDDVKTWPWMMWKPSREETLVTRTKNSDWLVWSLQLPMKPIQICMIFPHTNTATKVLVTAPYTFWGKATKLMISCTPPPRKWTNVLWKRQQFKRKSHLPTINFQLRTLSFQADKPSEYFIMAMANSAWKKF